MTSTASAAAPPWQARHLWLLAGAVVAGVAIRVALLPAPGFVGDIDQFVEWVGHIGRNGLPQAYDAHLSFGPVMVYVWWLIGLLDPGVVAAVDSSDAAVRVAMKLPAIAADLAIAGLAFAALRRRPAWAAVVIAVLLLHPAIWFISAWWGTYDSVYTAFAVAAFALAIVNRNVLAVIALTFAVMTKPQAAPLVVPFAAWYLARAGWSTPSGLALGPALGRLLRLGAVGLGTLVVLWLPFVAANGPANYVYWLGRYQSEFYALLSISAWNPWWVVQQVAADGKFILDSAPLAGPLTFRLAGYLLTGIALLAIALCVARRPTPRVLGMALAAAAFAAFELLTTMHERYVFAAVPFLAFLLDDRRIRWLSVAFGVTFSLNLLAATEHYLGTIVPFHGPITVAGSIVNLGLLVVLLLELLRGSRVPERPAVINEVAPATFGAAPPSTSAGSAGATSAA